MTPMQQKNMNRDAGAFIASYVRIWSFCTFTRVFFRSGKELVYNNAVAVAVIPPLIYPKEPIALLLGFGTRIFAMISSLPYLHDSQHWCLQSDLAVFGAILGTLCTSRLLNKKKKTKKNDMLESLNDPEAAEIVRVAAPTIRFGYIAFYFAAGWWKWNEGAKEAVPCWKRRLRMLQLLLNSFPFRTQSIHHENTGLSVPRCTQ